MVVRHTSNISDLDTVVDENLDFDPHCRAIVKKS